ncbi:hypothetical protein SAMN05216188_13130 [Lentzea xinjiangensis]|uniref:Uncharacterized protein n=1 Tax=Lentzea xinjiangensis TaxID=402600 RepID=A0A1H9W7Y4_9PSEU|nr:hypothetical protein [Lentzea xinjiangensis]SES29955.1 hypothetical protein SAMN05216188_13130 [Lentzea xinjiangensis]
MAGVDPAALVEVINDAQAEGLAVQVALYNVPAPVERDVAEICAAIDSIGDVGAALRGHARDPTRPPTRATAGDVV